MKGGKKMSRTKKENIFIACFFTLTLLMTNPPVINLVSKYVETKPLTLGWPTLWVWLQFWYLTMIGGAIWFSLKFKVWNTDYIEESTESILDGGEK